MLKQWKRKTNAYDGAPEFFDLKINDSKRLEISGENDMSRYLAFASYALSKFGLKHS